ncbi:MAG: flagellar filament capping protein FliD [Pseudomonadota bacterium]
MAISSGGIGSGLPVESLVTQLMAVERKPLDLLTSKEAGFQAKLSAFGTMKSTLAALQTAAKALSTPAQLAPMKASVLNATVMGVSAGAGATAGSYNIEVQTLAESQKLKTAVGFSNTTDIVGSGVITFDFGSYDTGNPPVFTANVANPTKTVTIDPAARTLADIKAAINNANIGVTASIINDGSANYLAFTSTSGAANAMKISVSDPSLNALSFDGDPLTSNMAQTVAAQDAVIFVDTVKVTKSSNTITDAIEGITLNLTATTATGVTTKVSVTPQMADVKTAIEAYVKTYNEASKSMADLTAYDVSTGKGAVLNGDGTVRSVQNQLRALIASSVTGAPAGSASLTDIGITTQRDGSLAIDATKLNKALADPSKNLSALFAGVGTSRGFGAQMDVVLGRILSPVGTITSHTKSINSSIKDIGKQRDTLTARLVGVETRYRKQFSALDVAMASMTTTSSYLTQQLASLAKNS